MQHTQCSSRALAARAGTALLIAASSLVATRAAAEPPVVDDSDVDAAPPYRVFVYTRPAEKNYFRLTLEEVGILAAGAVEYFQNQRANAGDWDLSFSADSFEDKVAGRAVAFDANKFGTNWALHPIGGWLYYGAARGNRLGPVASLFVAAVASAAWEWIGEYREQASINDLIVTPLGGASLAEPLIQLGAWFERGRPTFGRSLMATLLAPTKRVHDALDDAQPLREPAAPRGELSGRVYVASGPTWRSGSRDAAADIDIGLRTHLFHGPSAHTPGAVRTWLDDGNLSTLRATGTVAGSGLVDARLATRVAFVGYYSKDVRAERGQAWGNTSFVGIGTGVDYQWHRYDRAGRGADDQIAILELLGSTLENWFVAGPVKVRGQLALSFDFAGIGSLALEERRRRRGDAGLPTVLTTNSYAHAFGGTVAPHLSVSLPAITLFGEARLDVFRSVIDRDRYYDSYSPSVSGADERFVAAAGLERSFFDTVDVGLKFSHALRRSRLEEVTRTFHETGLRVELGLPL